MKRIISLALSALLIISVFAGCGSKSLYYKDDMSKYMSIGEYSNVVDKTSSDYSYAAESFYENTFGDNLKVKITEGNVESGDIANIDYKGLLDGVAFQGGTATGYDLEIGSGNFIDGFESGLIGAVIGETTNLNLTFPEEYHSEDLAGKAVVFEVKVNYVTKKNVPTEENITRYGFSSLADYEKKLEEYASAVCLFYSIYRTAVFDSYPKKEENLLYNYLVNYYEEACAQNNMTMNDLALSNSMTEEELYDYLKEYEVRGEMEFYMVAYYILQENDAKVTKEEVEAKKTELTNMYEQPLEDIGYNDINIQQAVAYEKALDILKGQVEIKK